MLSELKTNKFWLRYDDEYSDIRDALYDLDKYIQLHRQETYKNKSGDGTSVYSVNINGKLFVVKRYNTNTSKLALKRIIFGNNALASWNGAQLLHENNIPTIKPVAMIQHYKYRLRSHAFFVSEYKKGITARKYFALDSPMKDHWPKAFETIAALTKKLKLKGIVHDDYHCANILMVDHQPYLLDLDHVRQFPTNSKAFAAEHDYDVEHFCRLLAYNPEVQAKLRLRLEADLKA